MNRPTSSPKRPFRRAVMASIGVSVILHALLLGVLLFAHVADRQYQQPLSIGVATGPHSPADDLGQVRLPAAAPESTGVDAHLVRARIAEMVSVSQQQSIAENLQELTVMSRRLGAMASEQSLRDLAGHFQQWMGLRGRATEPQTTEASGSFEFDTAQFHDVRRSESKPGHYDYSAVLIDASGRTLEVPMTETEGRDLFELMQRLKSNPLLEKIYRSIAMPLLDNLLQGVRAQAEVSESTRSAASAGEPIELAPK